MRSRLSRLRLRPGTVLGAIAVFFAIGGIGYAASKIGTNEIKDGAVTKAKLHKNSVVSKKVKNHSLKCKDLKKGCLKGPAGPRGATGPAGAANLGGLTGFADISYVRTSSDSTETTVFNGGGLVLVASCASGVTDVVARTTADNAAITSSSVNAVNGANTNTFQDVNFDTGTDHSLVGDNNDKVLGHTEYLQPSGAHVTVHWSSLDGDAGFDNPECAFNGYAAVG